MKKTYLFFLLALVAWNCSTLTIVTPTGREKSLSYADLNAKLPGDDARIHFIDGQRAEGAGIRLDVDSTSWVDTKTGGIVKVSTLTIEKIETKNGLAGGLLGLGTGLAAGGLIGLIVGEGAGQRQGDVGIGLEVVAFTVGGALLGGGVGTIVGASIGTSHNYEIANDSTHHYK
jgi:hypothetical protein